MIGLICFLIGTGISLFSLIGLFSTEAPDIRTIIIVLFFYGLGFLTSGIPVPMALPWRTTSPA